METPATALIKALEASLALHQDELTGIPDWSIGVDKFWMKLADLGFEIAPRQSDQSDGTEIGTWTEQYDGSPRGTEAAR